MADRQEKLDEAAAMHVIDRRTEIQRAMNNWQHIIRATVWPGLDKLFVVVATHGAETVVVSLDTETARQLRDNIDTLIGIVERGEHKTKGGGYPPPC